MEMHLARNLLIGCSLVITAAACDGPSEPLRPEVVIAVSEPLQSGVVGESVADPPAVRVSTAGGRAVPGVTVTFSVSSDGGALTGATQQTDASGVATLTDWVLGTTLGEHTVTASVSGLQGPGVAFRAAAAAGPAVRIHLTSEPPAYAVSGEPLVPYPVVQLVDRYRNSAPGAGLRVSADIIGAGARLLNAEAITDATGRAAFDGLAISGTPGEYLLIFSADEFAPVSFPAPLRLFTDVQGACGPARALTLEPGEIIRSTLSGSAGLACLDFEITANAGEQFLILLENMPVTGPFTAALFCCEPTPSAFAYTLHSVPRTAAGTVMATAPTSLAVLSRARPERATHVWDFGAGPIYEIEPTPPPGMRAPQLRTMQGTVDLARAAAAPAVGDTVEVWMEALPRLSIPAGYQKAIVRHVSDLLVIAEDVRLGTTLRREGGGLNTPLHPDTMAAIAADYAAWARVQGDLLFENRHNAAVENGTGRVLAVHSLMPADNIWGYTYSIFDYFVWDYWVLTDGTNAGLNQSVQRNVDNLFMHEITHMRHLGLLERHGMSQGMRGNRWLVEGFARFTERLPIAARLLGTQEPSRTANVVLPRNPAFGNLYFRDDVPTFLNAHTSMFGGYQHSSFVFDYLADQVALQGGDWRAAVREFVVAAGSMATLDAAVDRRVGLTFGELFTRARIALYLDDIGMPGLPPWTQYHQFQLRASRPAGNQEAADPRNAWTVLVPGTPQHVSGSILPGAAWGFVVDGTQATGSTVYSISGPSTGNAIISVTRTR
jgi:hypothetical protein